MSTILNREIENYLSSLLPARTAVQQEQEAYAQQHHVPIIGPLCGRMLYQLARLIGLEESSSWVPPLDIRLCGWPRP